MWRLMNTDTVIVRRNDATTPVLLFARTVICLISLMFTIMFTSILIVTTLCEHITNICIGLLSVVMMFLIVYSITAAKTSLARNTMARMTAFNENTSIWTTVSDMTNIRETEDLASKDPPSYESVIKDPNHSYASPPPYSAVFADNNRNIFFGACRSQNRETDDRSRNNSQIIIDVTTLSDVSSP